MSKKFYLTTTLPYVNAKPHLGFALEIVQADVTARYHRLLGDDVFFNTGTDEHGTKIYQKAEEGGKDPQAYVDEYAAEFDKLKEGLNLSYDNFIRTTDEDHKKAAQEFWKRCSDNGYIYKKKYSGLYCVGCELFIKEKDLVDGECPDHKGQKPVEVSEENYFFKFSEFKKKLLDFYKENPNFVVPQKRFNEIIKFIEGDVEDFSISRLKEKMPWGVPVPGDDEHVMYVWFDALINYISTLGWPENVEQFEKFWPGMQFGGKDQVRQQAAMWQAMLMSIDLPNSTQIVIHGFLTSGGEKMSKTTGNVLDPYDFIEEYGTDSVRYFLARHIHPFEDSDVTKEGFKEVYNANLANGLGNLVARIMKMAEDNLDGPIEQPNIVTFSEEYTSPIESFELNKAMDYIWKRIGEADQKITDTEPFKLVKTDKEKAKEIISELVLEMYHIARLLNPFMPETSEKIKKAVLENKKPETLFERK